jgi:hypothetical protein
MATNPKVRAALIAKTAWSKQTLSANVQKLKNVTPMSTDDAVCILAHRKGIKIDKFLDSESMVRVRSLVHVAPPPAVAAVTRVVRVAGRGSEKPKVLSFGSKFKVNSTMLDPATLAEAKEMAEIYPVLYVLENSMREVVKRVMAAKHGADWWDTQLTSAKLSGVRNTAASRMKKESKQRWHQRRGEHPIYYIGLDELGDIINGKPDAFFTDMLAADIDWFRQFMRELEPSRNVLCHMNPLSATNAKDVTVKLERWEALVAGSPIPEPLPKKP